MNRILVIGGCGFIGSHIVDALIAQGHHLRVLDMRPEAFRSPLPGVEYVKGSFLCEEALEAALRDVDAVIHTVSTTVPATSNQDPKGDIEDNLVGTVRLLQVMRRNQVRKLVFLSSGGTIYGIPHAEMVSEDHPTKPISSYGIVKLAIENYLHMEHMLHGLNYIALRAANPYGPRQGRAGLQGIIGTYLWKVASGDPVEIWGDGSVVRDFIAVQDLAEATAMALEASINGCFNIGSGEGASVKEIVELTARITGRDIKPIYKPGRGFDVPRIVLDISRIRNAICWKPKTRLEAGIRDNWYWIQNHKKISVAA